MVDCQNVLHLNSKAVKYHILELQRVEFLKIAIRVVRNIKKLTISQVRYNCFEPETYNYHNIFVAE